MADDSENKLMLRQGLGTVEATALVVGGTIGTSIFVIPSAVAAGAGSPLAAIGLWCVAGALAFAAGLCLAELSSAIPQTGGPYVFLRRAYRTELISFAYAWMISFAYGPGAMAVVAIISATFAGPYLQSAFHLGHEPIHETALALLVATCTINVLGVRVGGFMQSALTLGKVILLAALIVIPFSLLHVDVAVLAPRPDPRPAGAIFSGLAAGLLLCIFAFNGAHFATLAAGEVRKPGRAIPIAIATGMTVVAALYLSFNVVLLTTLPFASVVASKRIAFDVMVAALGPVGAAVAAITVFTSSVAVLNAQSLGYPRVLFSLARDGLFFRQLAKVDPRTRVPASAIVVTTACAVAFAFSGTYADILGYVAFVSQFFMTMIVFSLIVLRMREPGLERPYRVWGYPYTPIVFVLVSSLYLVDLLVTKTATVAVGIAIVAAGIPVYFLFRSAQSDGQSTPTSTPPV